MVLGSTPSSWIQYIKQYEIHTGCNFRKRDISSYINHRDYLLCFDRENINTMSYFATIHYDVRYSWCKKVRFHRLVTEEEFNQVMDELQYRKDVENVEYTKEPSEVINYIGKTIDRSERLVRLGAMKQKYEDILWEMKRINSYDKISEVQKEIQQIENDIQECIKSIGT
jgi:hypothetical protein